MELFVMKVKPGKAVNLELLKEEAAAQVGALDVNEHATDGLRFYWTSKPPVTQGQLEALVTAHDAGKQSAAQVRAATRAACVGDLKALDVLALRTAIEEAHTIEGLRAEVLTVLSLLEKTLIVVGLRE